jgi:hypothetical protein
MRNETLTQNSHNLTYNYFDPKKIINNVETLINDLLQKTYDLPLVERDKLVNIYLGYHKK